LNFTYFSEWAPLRLSIEADFFIQQFTSWRCMNRDFVCSFRTNCLYFTAYAHKIMCDGLLFNSHKIFLLWGGEWCKNYVLLGPLKMGPIDCPETSVRNYHYSLRNNPEERSSGLLRRGSLKSRVVWFMGFFK
jgi:hypothetical protein